MQSSEDIGRQSGNEQVAAGIPSERHIFLPAFHSVAAVVLHAAMQSGLHWVAYGPAHLWPTLETLVFRLKSTATFHVFLPRRRTRW